MSPKLYLIQCKSKNYSLLKKFKKIHSAILNEINMHMYHVKFSNIELSISNINLNQNPQYLMHIKIFHASAQLLFILSRPICIDMAVKNTTIFM
jgi:hypothetical protein